tara:strand:- start:555 stop:707 length:153 start_codon:yes stop_codon:yes gene_type:complete
VELGLEDDSMQHVAVRVVLDATGLSAIMTNRLKLKQEYVSPFENCGRPAV